MAERKETRGGDRRRTPGRRGADKLFGARVSLHVLSELGRSLRNPEDENRVEAVNRSLERLAESLHASKVSLTSGSLRFSCGHPLPGEASSGPRLAMESGRGESKFRIEVARPEGAPEFREEEKRLLAFLLDPMATMLAAETERLRAAEAEERAQTFGRLLDDVKSMLRAHRHHGLKGELAFRLVKEITGPVSGLLGLAEHLKGSLAGTEEAKSADVLHEEAMRARHILEQFAACVRQENPGEDPDLIEIPRLLSEVFETVAPLFRRKNVAQTMHLPPGDLRIRARPKLLGTFLADLLKAGLGLAAPNRGRVDLSASGDLDGIHLHTRIVHPEKDLASLPPEIRGKDPKIWEYDSLLDLAVLSNSLKDQGGRMTIRRESGGIDVRILLPAGDRRVPLRESPGSPIRED